MHRLQPGAAPKLAPRFRVPREQVPPELMEYWNRRLFEKRTRDWT